MLSFFPGLTHDDLPDGEGWAIERRAITTHNGTHLDAPYHYASTMDGGERAITIDEVPLEWCFRPAVKLDFRDLPDGYVVTAADVEAELERIGHVLQPLDIVVVNTRAGRALRPGRLRRTGCGMGREATLYLLERGVRVTGTDAWSWDAPFVHTAKRYARDRRRLDHLGRPPRRARDRLLPHREAAQPRGAARRRASRSPASRSTSGRLGGLDASGGDPALSVNQKRLPPAGSDSTPIAPAVALDEALADREPEPVAGLRRAAACRARRR